MSQPIAYFVTGTDTGIGKTLASGAMLHALAQRGVRAAGLKPVAAGAEWRDGAWRNEDAEALAEASSIKLPRQIATPYLLRDAAAPHIAAAQEGVTIDPAHIRACYEQARTMTDALVVEGVGGFRVPLSERYDTADLAQQLGLPLVLVVGLRLGCLSHALLTVEAIAARRLTLAGWIANIAEFGMAHVVDNVEALKLRLAAPFLGCVPRLGAPLAAAAAEHLDFSALPGWPADQC